MNKEQLDALLAEGKITQEEYDAKLKEIEGGGAGDDKKKAQEEFLNSDAFKKILDKQIQSATDRVRTEYSKEKKELQQELEALKAAQMTEEERKEAELKQEREALAAERAELARLKVENHATKILADKKLPLETLEFVAAEDESKTTDRIDKFTELVDKLVQAKVEEEFAKHGYTPGGGSSNKSVVNPFAKETFSLTEQGKLLRENPELAKKLAAQAGVKL